MARFSRVTSVEERAELLVVLAARGRQWCEEFVAELAGLRLPRDSASDNEQVIVDLLEPLIAHFSFALPSGRQYPIGWIDRVALLMARAARDAAAGTSAQLINRVTLNVDGTTHVDRRLLVDLELADVLAASPHLAETVDVVLSTPGIVGAVRRAIGTRDAPVKWQFVHALTELVRRELIDRERIIDRCLHALETRDDASTQRVLADVLVGLGLDPANLAGRMPQVLPMLRTARGPVTAVLLPVLLASELPTGLLVEVTTTLLDRPEKAQQQLLIRALCANDAVGRFGVDNVAESLRVAATASDLRIADRAGAVLKTIERETAAKGSDARTPIGPGFGAQGLWAARPAPGVVLQAPQIDPTVASLAELAELSRAESIRNWAPRTESLSLLTEARLLGSLTAACYDFPEEVLEWLRARKSFLGNGSVLDDVQNWADGLGLSNPASAHNPWEHFRRRLEHETMQRLGTMPELLSTPSLDDGTVTFDDLVRRMSRAREIGYGPMDLLQALLRLEPVDPARVFDLTGMTLRLAPELEPAPKSILRRTPDGVKIAVEWVLDGGLRYDSGGAYGGRVVLPDAARYLPNVPEAMLTPPRSGSLTPWSTDAKEFLVLPRFAELFAAGVEALVAESKEARRLTALIARLGEPGPATHALIARTLTHADAATRTVGAEAVLTLIGGGTFVSKYFTAACDHLSQAGELSLRRATGALEHVVVFGGMAAIWPTLLRLLDSACSTPMPPTGTADLLALVRRYAAEAPEYVPSHFVQALGDRSGSARVVQEARALVVAARSD
jgi:hypothetical protein